MNLLFGYLVALQFWYLVVVEYSKNCSDHLLVFDCCANIVEIIHGISLHSLLLEIVSNRNLVILLKSQYQNYNSIQMFSSIFLSFIFDVTLNHFHLHFTRFAPQFHNLLTRIHYIGSITFAGQARENACQKYINQYNFHHKI